MDPGPSGHCMNVNERKRLMRERETALDARSDRRRVRMQALEDKILKPDEIRVGARHVKHVDPGIYFLIKSGQIVYVGQSKWVHTRLREHIHKAVKNFDSYFIQYCQIDELTMLESIYIARYQPKYNQQPVHDRNSMWDKQLEDPAI